MIALATGMLIGCQVRRQNDHPAVAHDTTSWPPAFGFGSTVSQRDVDSLDFDVRPDGKGLPVGSGTYLEGKLIYRSKCATCHGVTGIEGPYNRLVHVSDTSDRRDEKTIGNYWPYATTLFDYVYRAMPYDKPGSLTSKEVYSIVAFLLSRNQLIDSSIHLSNENLAKVVMPAKELFVADDRENSSEIR